MIPPQICEGRGFSWWARIVTGPCPRPVEWAERRFSPGGHVYHRYLCAKHALPLETITGGWCSATGTGLIPWTEFVRGRR